jgi:hypothetical protein
MYLQINTKKILVSLQFVIEFVHKNLLYTFRAFKTYQLLSPKSSEKSKLGI